MYLIGSSMTVSPGRLWARSQRPSGRRTSTSTACAPRAWTAVTTTDARPEATATSQSARVLSPIELELGRLRNSEFEFEFEFDLAPTLNAQRPTLNAPSAASAP